MNDLDVQVISCITVKCLASTDSCTHRCTV